MKATSGHTYPVHLEFGVPGLVEQVPEGDADEVRLEPGVGAHVELMVHAEAGLVSVLVPGSGVKGSEEECMYLPWLAAHG